MGCGCGKKKLDEIDKKYGDGGVETTSKTNLFVRIIEFILQMLFGILCAVIIIVMMIPMLAYVIICMIFGKQPSFRIKNLSKYLNKE